VGAGARQSGRGRHRPTDHRRRRAVRGLSSAGRAGRGPAGGALASASRAPGIDREARARGASPALDSRRPRPRRWGRREAGDRAGVRGGLPAVLVRVSPEALGARRAPGADRSVLEAQAVGAGDGHRRLLRGDSALGVDGGDRGTGLGPPPAQALAGDVARGGDAGRRGPPRRDRHAAGRGPLARPVQRLSAPARPAVGEARDGRAGALRGRPAGAVPQQTGGRGGAGVTAVDRGRAGPRAQAGQDPHRAPAGGRRGPRFPRLPSPSRARRAPPPAPAVPRPLALTRGNAKGPRSDP
jgi:hypothetical protein